MPSLTSAFCFLIINLDHILRSTHGTAICICWVKLKHFPGSEIINIYLPNPLNLCYERDMEIGDIFY